MRQPASVDVGISLLERRGPLLSPPMELVEIEIVADRTAQSRCDSGFLRVSRLELRNVYADGSRSAPYPCDVVSRPGSDAVVAVLYDRGSNGGIRVLLREAPRAPIYLRRHKRFVHPDPRVYASIVEVVAGIVEEGDGPGAEGRKRRAAQEALEEAGCGIPADDFREIGGETFASPGTSDEKVYYCAGATDLGAARDAPGDGSVMEEAGRLVVMDLAAAIEACRSGSIPDMKTEVALLRLADHLGWIPQLGLFADELTPELARRYRRLGVSPTGDAGTQA
jgi:ADP-ribose pyrophosphatase